MKIIGCDLHARQQTLAILDSTTGEVGNATLKHEGNNVREFYSKLPRPSGRDSSGGTAKTKAGSSGCGAHSDPASRKSLPSDLVTYERTLGFADLIAAPASVGVPAGQNSKCVAGHCLGEWSPARLLTVDPSRPTRDRVLPRSPHAAYRRNELQAMYRKFESAIENLNQRVQQQARERVGARLLMTHPGVGPITALATEVFQALDFRA